ncbi:thiosulfate sulfurtransferase [Histoplasma ohiense]|nr:thiosulfate sulfurtransferase [Histoplasma ohiense (nom. inval.)]
MALAALRSFGFSSRIPRTRSTSTTSTHSPQRRSISLSSYLVTPKELNDALKKNARTKISTSPRVIPLCATWFMPNDPAKRTGIEAFKKCRIPHARFFDIDAVKDHDSPYPHMLPSKESFQEAMQSLGIRRDDQVVVYDSEEVGLFSAPRVGWTLRVFGHSNVHVLNNFKLWVQEGYPTESGDVSPEERSNYTVGDFTPRMVVHFTEMKEIAESYGKEGSEGIRILDARPAGRFTGKDNEPRPGLPSGHMPGSTNLPFSELLDANTKTLLPASELRKIFEARGINPAEPTVSSCGTGVTAAIIELALKEADDTAPGNRRIYDGSWTEWAQRVTEASGLIQKS